MAASELGFFDTNENCVPVLCINKNVLGSVANLVSYHWAAVVMSGENQLKTPILSRERDSGVTPSGNNEGLKLVKFHLRRELPCIHTAAPSYTLELCHPDVIFTDNIHGITIKGKRSLALSLMAFRQTLPLCVSQPSCQVLWINQHGYQQLHSRWRIVGFPRTTLTGQHYCPDFGSECEVTFTFQLDSAANHLKFNIISA
eukprot:gene9420-10393_t